MLKTDEALHKQIFNDVKSQIFEDVKKLVEKGYTEKLLKKEEEVKEKLVTIEELVKKLAEKELVPDHLPHKREYQLIVDWVNKLEKKDENAISDVLKEMQARIEELIKIDKDMFSPGVHRAEENMEKLIPHNERREPLMNNPAGSLDDTERILSDIRDLNFFTQGNLQSFKNIHSHGTHNDSAIIMSQSNNNNINMDLHNQSSSSNASLVLPNDTCEHFPIPRSMSPQPPSSLKRQKMIYIVNKEGQFKLQYGLRGKNDGQLFYPNRVAVNQMTGHCVITERCPNHQIQIFDSCGRFIRKFGSSVLQYPRGVCVDHKGRIIIVESKVGGV
ncbi:hypothetical protein FO519_010236 [Halicephalobus sp. NKZ332]|nr:hypothetical protein FO519_010236 [Halicephalobus sp. NKZ332]